MDYWVIVIIELAAVLAIPAILFTAFSIQMVYIDRDWKRTNPIFPRKRGICALLTLVSLFVYLVFGMNPTAQWLGANFGTLAAPTQTVVGAHTTMGAGNRFSASAYPETGHTIKQGTGFQIFARLQRPLVGGACPLNIEDFTVSIVGKGITADGPVPRNNFPSNPDHACILTWTWSAQAERAGANNVFVAIHSRGAHPLYTFVDLPIDVAAPHAMIFVSPWFEKVALIVVAALVSTAVQNQFRLFDGTRKDGRRKLYDPRTGKPFETRTDRIARFKEDEPNAS